MNIKEKTDLHDAGDVSMLEIRGRKHQGALLYKDLCIVDRWERQIRLEVFVSIFTKQTILGSTAMEQTPLILY